MYKVFSNIHILKLPHTNDSNTLNKSFYTELLHIIGIEEVTVSSKRFIKRKRNNRYAASLLENVINKLKTDDSLSVYNEKELKAFGLDTDEQEFNVALQLCITWINRILFLKLLESQLINYNNGDKNYRFLTIDKITDFDELHRLFFQVLAVDYEKRTTDVNNDYPNVPYLNSSLFEISELEQKTIKISGLSQKEKLPILSNSILKKQEKYRNVSALSTIEYLFLFLDSYNFGSDKADEITEDNKTLISASVLGLIFEKINGHKDGAVFTPGYITMYMCQQSIRNAIVQKFNDTFEWNCSSIKDIYNKDLDIVKANEIIDSIKVCDPAVGSGHFLVSALNEIILIKFELGILVDANGKRIKKQDYTFTIENDELLVSDAENENLFEYHPKQVESQRIQETLFNEKKKIIENCLYGVDINPNSVNICRLRLWIELLKNSYYTASSDYKHLETLPNIDINIKCGNSLLMKHTLADNINQVLANTTLTVKKYKDDVKAYKATSDKANKKEIEHDIQIIKSQITSGLSSKSPVYKEWAKANLELLTLENDAFESTDTRFLSRVEAKRKNVKKLKEKVDDLKENSLFRDAFEWRYEFPEVLDATGRFEGFDCIIGNPPYGVSFKNDLRTKIVGLWGHLPDYEIYYYFIELARQILKPHGTLGYIVPNTWLFNMNASMFRNTVLNHWKIIEILDCSQFNIFESVTVRNTVFNMQLSDTGSDVIGFRNTSNADKFSELINEELEIIAKEKLLGLNQNWGLAFSRSEEIIELVEKIKSSHSCLINLFPDISQGLIAYDKYRGQSKKIIENRAYHYSEYKEGLKRWLWGEDITRYGIKWNGKEYIDYCDGIANPREPKFFVGRRLLVREITNPSIYATIVNEEYYNDPAILIVLESELYSLKVLCAILNSNLATFYHFNHSPKATKGAFPKILIADLKNFPLPEISEKAKTDLEEMVDEIAVEKKANNQKRVEELDEKIDNFVLKLYHITDNNEIEMIKSSIKI
ncbi:Eco57I restriction-modification methylase domain-containing protein [Prevotella amnii]|uniref:type IIG restriction enzyme/methyltransferase n=1 Tax=Prevotella amnii TaxID=419005 RepID=UPI0012B5848F|nr:TaqI-like C-terminal specificity domain-containing protein [Prevotella amnii]